MFRSTSRHQSSHQKSAVKMSLPPLLISRLLLASAAVFFFASSSAAVEITMGRNVAAAVAAADPVRVELYYESMCPACKNFFTTQLFRAWQTFKGTGKIECT